jgi:hypothetical protein
MAVTTEKLQQIFQKIAAALVEQLAAQATKSTASGEAEQLSTSLGKPSDRLSSGHDLEELATQQVQQLTSDFDPRSANFAGLDEANAGGVTQVGRTETRHEGPPGRFAAREPEEVSRRAGDQQDAARHPGRKFHISNGAERFRDRDAGDGAPSVEFREPLNQTNQDMLTGIRERLLAIDKLSNEVRALQAGFKQFGRGFNQIADLTTEHQPSAQNFGGRP